MYPSTVNVVATENEHEGGKWNQKIIITDARG